MSVFVQGVEIFTNPTIQGTVSPGTGLTMPAFTLGGTVTLAGQSLSGQISQDFTSTATVGNALNGSLTVTASPAAASTATYFGLLVTATSSSANIGGAALWGMRALAETTGAASATELMGIRASAQTGSSGTVTSAYGIFSEVAATAGTITNAYVLYARAPVAVGTITNRWGLYLEDITAGTIARGIEWVNHLQYSAAAFAFQENTVISRVAAAGVAAAMGFNIPISAGGAANAVVQWYFQLDTVTEAGLFGETDGAGTYTQAKTMWKVPYRDSGANVAAPTAPTTAATWLGGLRVEAGDDTNRIYFYANEAWHYINQTAGLSITAEERVDPWTGHRWEISDLAVVRMRTAYGDGGADFLPYPLEEALKEILAKPKWREWLRTKLEV